MAAAIAPTLVEPTLFGYAKGAFTGATANKSGYFEDAADGTLFLDEIGELPLELQAKLLRVLENGEYNRVGETQQRFSRARVVAATNRDLRAEIRKGAFRADLYHRLSVFTLQVPPLREMEGDREAAAVGALPPSFYSGARRAWQPFSPGPRRRTTVWSDLPAFPGNVRELRNIVIRLTTKHPGQKLARRRGSRAGIRSRDQTRQPRRGQFRTRRRLTSDPRNGWCEQARAPSRTAAATSTWTTCCTSLGAGLHRSSHAKNHARQCQPGRRSCWASTEPPLYCAHGHRSEEKQQ